MAVAGEIGGVESEGGEVRAACEVRMAGGIDDAIAADVIGPRGGRSKLHGATTLHNQKERKPGVATNVTQRRAEFDRRSALPYGRGSDGARRCGKGGSRVANRLHGTERSPAYQTPIPRGRKTSVNCPHAS